MVMICGVDEAGKGSVLGPLVVAAVGCTDMQELVALGVQDSKKLSPKKRYQLNQLIRKHFPYSLVIRTAEEIDRLRFSITMNDIVARAHAEALDALPCSLAYLDACDVNEKRYEETVYSYIHNKCELIARHKADDLFSPVSAASIVAKVERDQMLSDLASTYGEIGSGYPSDPVTITYLQAYIRKENHPPEIARSSWETVKQMMYQKNQRSILDY